MADKVRSFALSFVSRLTSKLSNDLKVKVKVKVNQSHYSSEQALRVPEGWGSHISRQSAHESGKVVSPPHRPSLVQRKYSRYSFLLEAESKPIVRQEGLCQWKIPMTPSGIEPATFRLVTQYLNQLCYDVSPPSNDVGNKTPSAATYILSCCRTRSGSLQLSVCDEIRILDLQVSF